MMIFDSHAHYDDAQFDTDREALLASLPLKGVKKIVNIGCDLPSSRRSIALAKQYDNIYAAVGFHPENLSDVSEEALEEIRLLSRHPKVCAIGEIGLDYYYDEFAPEVQRHWFQKQLQLAWEEQKPIIVHSREAAQDTFDLIAQSKVRHGVIHCFSSSAQMAKEYVKMGFYIGIGGVITYKNAKKLVEVVQEIPLERILIETDCPYLAPVPNRGKRNDSSNLVYVVEKIAQIKGVSPEEVASKTFQNAENMYFGKF